MKKTAQRSCSTMTERLKSVVFSLGSQPPWGRLPFFWGSRELLIEIFMMVYFIVLYGTTFCRSQNNRITWQKR